MQILLYSIFVTAKQFHMKTGNKIFFVLCAITIIAGVLIYLEASDFQKTAKVTVGTVANSSLSRYEIQYTSDDGIERIYKGIHSSKGRIYHNGEKLKVFYKIDNPDNMRITDGVKSGKKVVKIGIIMILFNLLSVYSDRKKTKSENNFKTTGRKVEAQIMKVDKDTTVTIQRKNPYCIDCRWVDPITGKEYTHTIRYVWKDPEILLAGRNSIDVYIERNDPEKYFMDISFLGVGAK
jgi:hypothetical protein